MKHIIPTLALTTLVAASAVAQVAGAKKNALSYDRVGISFAKSGDAEYTTFSTSAALGEYLTISANYVDVGGDTFGLSMDGRLTTVGIGAKFNVGPGDIQVGYRYGLGAITYGTVSGDIGEQDAFSIGYRQKFARDFEFGVEVAKLETDTVFQNFDVTPITLSLRYNFSGFDITASFSTEDTYGLQDDENSFSLGVGYSF
jgi:hypothetical protein